MLDKARRQENFPRLKRQAVQPNRYGSNPPKFPAANSAKDAIKPQNFDNRQKQTKKFRHERRFFNK